MAGKLNVREIENTGGNSVRIPSSIDMSTSTSYMPIPAGGSDQVDSNVSEGAFRYNYDFECLEFFDGQSWRLIEKEYINTTGLVLHLDARSIESYPRDNNGKWFDLSGNKNDAYAGGSPLPNFQFNNTSGNNRPHFNFTGASSGGHFVCRKPNLVNYLEGTVAAYVRFDTITSNRVVVSYGGNNLDRGFLLQTENNTVRKIGFYTNTIDGSWYQAALGESLSNPYVGQWIYMVGTWNPYGSALWINGDLRVQVEHTAFNPLEDDTTLWIGGEYNRANYFLDGGIACVHLYNRQLSAKEIADNYAVVQERYN